MKTIKMIISIALSLCFLSVLGCSTTEQGGDTEKSVKQLSLNEIAAPSQTDDGTLPHIEAENIESIINEAILEAQRIYDEYDEVIIPEHKYKTVHIDYLPEEFAYMPAGIVSKTSLGNEYNIAEMSPADIAKREADEYCNWMYGTTRIATELIIQKVSEERCIRYIDLIPSAAIANTNIYDESIVCCLACDSSNDLMSLIPSKNLPLPCVILNVNGSHISIFDKNGSFSMVYPTEEMNDRYNELMRDWVEIKNNETD